jgi:diguanylate cyclase (GGDEF)-like protein
MSGSAASIQPLVQLLARARYGFGLLLLVTIVSLAWQHFGMEKIDELTDGRYPIRADDDRTAGGASVARLERRPNGELVLHCRLVKKADWPYCKLNISFSDTLAGVDMSGSEQLNIDLRYKGPGIGKPALILLNAEDGFTQKERWETYKVNQVEGLEVPADGKLVVPFKWLNVPQWWKELARPPMKHSYGRIDNVVALELTIGGWAAYGDHEFVLQSVRMHSKYVSQGKLLMLLVTLWILAAMGWLTAAALTLGRQLRDSDAALALLGEVNKALELEARELADQAHIDPLTSVLNRQGLRAALMGSPTLLANPMSVVFIDIDHFKSINDNHGHDVGDQVLRAFAGLIASKIRKVDRLVRWGGEEFLIVCPLTDGQQAAFLADNLLQALRQHAWPVDLRVTASFGVAQHQAGAEIGTVIKQADQALYCAKNGGRNQVRVFGPAPGLSTAA